jgi:ubiquinone/menaquinone biosynthesis C-methylase UbiE
MVLADAPIIDHLSALADATRARLLLLLERQALTVTELCAITQLPQSTVSRHLKALGDTGWVGSRAEGTSNLYSVRREDLDQSARGLWTIVRQQVGATTAAAQDQHRLARVLAARRTKSEEFFSSSAGQWDRLREELFGERVHMSALLGLLDERWRVGDLGCGTGAIAEILAPLVAEVVAVDSSAAMLQAARRRLKGRPNVDLRRGHLESLPLDAGTLDAATMVLVLHHVSEPEEVLAEVRRVLKPQGRVMICDMLPHDRDAYRQQMGHVWLGFSQDQMTGWLELAGFTGIRFHTLPADPRAKGPALFVVTARRATESQRP